MRLPRAATLAILTSVGCAYHNPPNPTSHYSSRIATPTPIPREYDPVVPIVDSTKPPRELPDRVREPEARPDKPITLEQAEELAMRFSPKIAEAMSFTSVAASRERVAFAAFLPTVGANYAFQGYSSNSGFAGTPDGGRFPVLPIRGFGPGNQDFEVLDLRVQWTIFQFGKRLALHDQAAMKAEIVRWQLERTRQAVAFDVDLHYAQVLQARAAQVVAERAVVRAEAALKDVRNLAENGVLTKEDVLRADVFLADVRQGLISATSETQIAVAALNRSIGINISSPTRVVERSPEMEEYPVKLEECLAQAIGNRPEFVIVRLGVASAARGTDATRADFMPVVSTSFTGSVVEGSRVQNAQVAGASIAIKWNLFEGGRRQAELHGAEAEMGLALAQGQQVCDTIAFETHVAYRNIEDAIGRLKQSRTAIDQATETLRLVRNRYNRGDAKPTDIVDAETALIKAEQNLNSARYDLLIALARMKFAVGAAPQRMDTLQKGPAVEMLPAPRPLAKP